MKFRSLTFVLAAALMMVLAGVVAAQDDMGIDLCFGLSSDDCDYIDTASFNGVGDASSFTIEYDLSFSVAGIPDEMMDELYFDTAGEITAVETEGMLPINIGIFGDAFFAEAPDGITYEASIVDDFAYVVDPMSGDAYSVSIASLLTSETFSDALDELPFDPMTGEGMDDLMDDDDLPSEEELMSLLRLINLPGLIDYVREGDAFIFTLDLTTLTAVTTDPAYAEEYAQITELLNEVDPSVAFLLPSILQLVDEGVVQVIQTVDPDTNLISSIEFYVDSTVQLGAFTGDMEAEPLIIDLDFSMDLVDLDATAPAIAPANAIEIDPNTLAPVEGA